MLRNVKVWFVVVSNLSARLPSLPAAKGPSRSCCTDPASVLLRSLGTLAVALCLLIASAATRAAVITYEVTSQGGSDWRYDYTVENDGTASIDQFTVYFDYGLFSNLAAPPGSPANWDSIVIQPDANIPSDGFFDSVALVSGLTPGASLSGFSVTFTFLGSGTPGPQPFDIVDPPTLEVLHSGRTLQAPTNNVPEPGTLSLLLMAGLLAAAKRSRRLDH